MSEEKELLIAAKSKIDTPAKWTKNSLAKDKQGAETNYWNQKAVCFCSLGALKAASMQAPTAAYEKAIDLLYAAAKGSFINFNDTHEHKEVMELWDKAIALAE